MLEFIIVFFHNLDSGAKNMDNHANSDTIPNGVNMRVSPFES